jgi:hypothetical protein
LFQFRYPAFNGADNFTLALTASFVLMLDLQVVCFSVTAFYYSHNRIHDASTVQSVVVEGSLPV